MRVRLNTGGLHADQDAEHARFSCHALLAALMIALTLLAAGCGMASGPENPPVTSMWKEDRAVVGFSIGTMLEERWQRDRDVFIARCSEKDADVLFQNANNDGAEQIEQVAYLIRNDIDVLVLAPYDADTSVEAVRLAREAEIPVISYDRLVRNAGVDLYIAFDSVKTGRMMAQAIVDALRANGRLERDRKAHAVPANIVIINGPESDNNAALYSQGYREVLQPLLSAGDVIIGEEVWAPDWSRETAFVTVERLLDDGVDIAAVIASNDNLAGGAIEALAERRLAGRVPVVGHDADLAGCQRIAEGTQLMTVYQPIPYLAENAADFAIRLAYGDFVLAYGTIDDGSHTVPFYKLDPIPVMADTLDDTVIRDGFHRMENIYRNVPKIRWPAP